MGLDVPLRRRTALAGALLTALTACTVQSTTPPPTTSTTTSSSTPPPADQVYVSLGDSYATGYRPDVITGAPTAGFTSLVAERSNMHLINVACSGATSTQLNDNSTCTPTNRAPDATTPTDLNQLDEAVQALRENKGRVGLVTVVIGGNDLAPCARAKEPLTCATQAVAKVRSNLATTLPTLREAAGNAKIIGLTYPDMFLGAWVSPSFPNGKDLATLSIPLFQNFFNTALKTEYEKIGATFVDITEKTGGYTPLTDTTQDPAYGPIPTSVAKVCALTYFCDLTDVHPTPAGHEAIATAVLTATGR